MARSRNPRKREAEARYPSRVDIPVSPGGLGTRLNEMLAWCRANIRAVEWGQHGHSEHEPGKIPVDFVRFYFTTEADAELFRWRWMKSS